MRKIIAGEEHPYNTDPEDYLINLSRQVSNLSLDEETPSKRVVKALQVERNGVRTTGFNKEVLNAIYEDACADFPSKEWRDNYLRRLKRWTGKNYLRHFYERTEILATWKWRDGCFVPDAYFIDIEKKTVVCFEVEDHHHLKPYSVERYGGAWFTLEYIYWDLHLISYDIYGNPRIIELPESMFIAKALIDAQEAKEKETTSDD